MIRYKPVGGMDTDCNQYQTHGSTPYISTLVGYSAAAFVKADTEEARVLLTTEKVH